MDGVNSALKIWNRGGLLFGKMWEDSRVELAVARSILAQQSECRVLAIASSGDTAFALASDRGVSVDATDINPAQIALCLLKQAILQSWGTTTLAECLYQDVRPTFERVKADLPHLCRAFWEENKNLLQHGFHRAGRIDRMMSFWVWLFSKAVVSRLKIDRLLRCQEPEEQRRMIELDWRGSKWDLAISIATLRPILRLIYGRELVERLAPDFSQQISQRMMHFLTSFEARTNPYLWQTFARHELGPVRPPYLQHWGAVDFSHGSVEQQVLKRQHNYDFFALSNILEVADPQQIRSVRDAILASANPGAKIVIRFMAARAPIWSEFSYSPSESSEYGHLDRAFFCNHIQIYSAKKG